MKFARTSSQQSLERDEDVSQQHHSPVISRRPQHSFSTKVSVDELNGLDCVRAGDSAGSIRLKVFKEDGVFLHQTHPILSYPLQSAVILELNSGAVQILEASNGQALGAFPATAITKIQMLDDGISLLAVWRSRRLEVGLSIRQSCKREIIYKLLLARVKAVLPMGPNEELPGAPSMAAIYPGAMQLTPDLCSTQVAASIASPSPTPLPREKRREILYAQLCKVRQRSTSLE